jgi:hypothetical protein
MPSAAGVAIPACPLALTAGRKFDERRQRALVRYYAAAGAGGLAVGVHTTQFAIRDPKHALLRPVLALAAEELPAPMVRVAGVCGPTPQAVAEAGLAKDLGYHAGLLSLAALKPASDDELIAHCRAVAGVLPVVGFYLQPAVGGRVLPYAFWRRFAEIENVVAVKIAPFNPLPNARRGPGGGRGRPGRHRPVHRERRQHRRRPGDADVRPAGRRRVARPVGGRHPGGGRAVGRVPAGAGSGAGRSAAAGGRG